MRRAWVGDAGQKPWGSCVRWTPLRPSTSEPWWSVHLPYFTTPPSQAKPSQSTPPGRLSPITLSYSCLTLLTGHFLSLPCAFPQVEECHLPGLGVALTLDYKPDTADDAVSPLVSYVSGLLLGTNGKVRTWFSMFIRNGQQVRPLPPMRFSRTCSSCTETLVFTSVSHTHSLLPYP